MYRKLVRTFFKPFLIIVFLAGLSITFYYALLDALKKHKNNPIAKALRIKSKDDVEMEKIYERSREWMSQSRNDKIKNILDNPIFSGFKIKKPARKKFVNVLVIVSSGPRRVDRRNSIRETWWADCKTTAHGVRSILLALY